LTQVRVRTGIAERRRCRRAPPVSLRHNWRPCVPPSNFSTVHTFLTLPPARCFAMPDDPRVYSDEEFAAILRKAGELANQGDAPASTSTGLTLREMQAAAAQVGYDPALVERAARELRTRATATPLDRAMGGPLRHHLQARFPVALTEAQASRLLSAIRISGGVAGSRDVGHSSDMGLTWHDGSDLESLQVTARTEGAGTTVSVSLDRRGTLGIVGAATGISLILWFLFSVFGLYPEWHAGGVSALVLGVGGIVTGARAYWASSTRRVRERLQRVMDQVGETLEGLEEK
jgi:hypothetical protein